jgi:hypothetical protein
VLVVEGNAEGVKRPRIGLSQQELVISRGRQM